MVREFQIKQNYGRGILSFIYFKTTETEEEFLEPLAIKEMLLDWSKINPALYFSAPKPARPTIEVCEHADGKLVKNGIRFKTKWR